MLFFISYSHTNKLVRFYKGVDGLKTGYTEEAGYCLTATANKNNMRLIAVVMGEADSSVRNNEVSKMLDYGYNLYQREVILDVNTIVGQIEVQKGKREVIDIVPKEEASILMKKGTVKKDWVYKLNIGIVNAPIKAGDIIGSIDILEDGKIIKTVPATVLSDVEKASIIELYIRHFKNIINGDIKFM